MKKIISVIATCLLLASCTSQKSELFVETESFTQKGGWLIDPQFVEQMGSPYLLAHGNGKPVNNAKTEVEFQNTGKYHVWVRTINWAPGNWEAPGRFRLVVDSVELQQDLGTETGWNWQYVGLAHISKAKTTIELQDLTGFAGRCDAIYFSTKKEAPTNDAKSLQAWRNSFNNQNITTQNFDLVVVGGGIAGCATAIAAAESGMSVALIHDRPVLGGNASSEVRVHTLGVTGHADRIVQMLNTKHWPNGDPEAKFDDEKRTQNISKYDNIKTFLNYRAFAVNTNDSAKILSVDAAQVSSGEKIRFAAPYFVDCTGDGWIGYWSGAEYMYGREESEQFKEAIDTYGINFRAHHNHDLIKDRWNDFKFLWSPTEKDNRVMGSSVLWRSEKATSKVSFPAVPWAMDIAKQHNAIHGEWYWEFSSNKLHQIENGEAIRDHMLKAIYGSFYNAKQNPENDSIQLQWVSYLLGKRESRRLVGDYIFTLKDAKSNTKFEDAVVIEKRDVDVHYQQVLLDSSYVDFLSDALYFQAKLYYVPYRSLYSKNINNLFMAGRCFSCSHIGLGGPRVMNTAGQMGVAVGYAASLAKKYNCTPRDIYQNHLGELLEMVTKEPINEKLYNY